LPIDDWSILIEPFAALNNRIILGTAPMRVTGRCQFANHPIFHSPQRLEQCPKSEWNNAPIGNPALNRPIGNWQSAMDDGSVRR
jgi:hypothetical protein